MKDKAFIKEDKMVSKIKTASGKKAIGKKHNGAVKSFIFTLLKTLIICFVTISCIVAGVLGGAVYGYIKTAPSITNEQLQIKIQTSFIYDDKGNEIQKLTGKDNMNRELVYYSEIPDYLKDAFISIEDERFFNHPGVDLKGLVNAAVNFLSGGRIGREGGGSTITMQVVRNITGQTRRTIQRKIQEQWNALRLERRLSKWQILELYMNIIYMGNSCYGVQSASKRYFGKDVRDLSLAECAYLAGITNNPEIYNPFTNDGKKNAKERQEIILGKMLELGKIDEKEYNEALKQKIIIVNPDDWKKTASTQSYFIDQVINEVKKDLMAVKGMSEEMALMTIYNYGIKIYSTQDSEIQKVMDEVFLDDKYFPTEFNQKAASNLEHPQASMIVMDLTGQVKAMYGGYGKKLASNTLNRATQIARQPGSSIKPIAVYAPAIDLGLITPASIFDDVPVYMMTTGKDKDKPYPVNYNPKRYDGLTSVRNAIKASVNVVAAKVWRDVLGSDQSIEYLKKVGIDRENEKYLSLVMGGLNKGVNPLQMAAAYVPFANKGMYYEPSTYTKVLDSDGNVLLEKNPQYHPAYGETTAFLMVDMLKEVCKPVNTSYPYNGTAASIINEKNIGMPVAGKTGTTSDNRDKWFVGFTPYYVAATWYGYDNRIKPIELTREEYNQAQLIWQAVMKKIHEGKEKIDFPVPSGIVKKPVCIYSGKTPTELCYKDPRGKSVIEEYFVKGTEPRYDDICKVHVSGQVCTESHDIWNRNLLAGPYCPLSSVVEKVFIQRQEPFVPVKPDDIYPVDWDYELPAGEYCTVHGPPLFNDEDEMYYNEEIDDFEIYIP